MKHPKTYKIRKSVIRTIVSLLIFYFFVPYLIPLHPSDIPNSNIVYDANGDEIGEIINQNKYRHINLTYEEFPDFLKKITVGLEDKRFWNHNGIDMQSIARATINNIQSKQFTEGGSTISSQLIRNLYWLNKPRTIVRKLAEFYLARIINMHNDKKQILTSYLNTISFGYLNYGFGSASRYFFAKPLQHLTKAEMIALLTIPKNPALYDPYKQPKNFKQRYEMLTKYFLDNQLITQDEYQTIHNEKLVFSTNHANKLPYITDIIDQYYLHPDTDNQNIGQYIHTTIDYNLTQKVYELARSTVMDLLWKDVGDFGVLVIDRKTSQVKVLLGGVDYTSPNGQVNSVLSYNQAGSAIKPFTYLLAFQNLGLKPNDTIIDMPIQFKTDQGYGYTPQNYNLQFKGEVTLAEALSQSLNVPALKMAEKVGVKNLLMFLRSLGISSLTKEPDYYGLALTLGVGEVSLRELTRAYSIFAHDGNLCDITLLSGQQQNCKPTVDKKYIDDIVQILSNRFFKLQEFPIFSNLDFPDRFVFLKSGTSRNFADNRTLGFTDNYIIGVWVGNKDGTPMKGVSGASGAGDIFNKLVYLLEKDNYQSQPVDLQAKHQDYITITSPLDKSVLKYDSSLPQNVQNIKLEFKTNVPYDKYIWTINDQVFTGQFRNIQTGNYKIVISLYNQGIQVASDHSNVQVD